MDSTYIFTIVFYIFCLAAFIQLFYITFFYMRLTGNKKKHEIPEQLPPVSVIICARNEDVNLKKNIPKILSQDYPQFEVIIVDDNSDDGTTEYLFFLSQKEPRLKRVKVGNTNPMMAGKKFPLTLGIKAANYELLILTDADCYPLSDQWLKNMVAAYKPEKEIVLGYGGYEKQKGLLNKIIRFETVNTALQYLSFALCRFPYMGVGRNLSYHKHLFFDSGGFFDHRDLPSGDDDLFINKIATKRNTSISINPQAFTYSAPKETWGEWKEQKTRHLSTGRFYKGKHKFLLGLQTASHIIFWLLSILLICIYFEYWYIVAGVFIFRWLLLRFVFTKTMKKLNEKDLIPFIEFFDFLQLLYYFRFSKAALTKTKYRWN